jgi:lipopolysaccharide export system permease protein
MIADLFPSRTLTLYLSRMFVTRILGVLDAGAGSCKCWICCRIGHDPGASGQWAGADRHYVTLRVPQLVARFLPYSVLLATLFTFFPLNQAAK